MPVRILIVSGGKLTSRTAAIVKALSEVEDIEVSTQVISGKITGNDVETIIVDEIEDGLFGDLDVGAPNHTDHTKRGFKPK